jgi:hypothetical protein
MEQHHKCMAGSNRWSLLFEHEDSQYIRKADNTTYTTCRQLESAAYINRKLGKQLMSEKAIAINIKSSNYLTYLF